MDYDQAFNSIKYVHITFDCLTGKLGDCSYIFKPYSLSGWRPRKDITKSGGEGQ